MSLYALALFVHVVGAVLVFAALTVEGVALALLRSAVGTQEAGLAFRLLRVNRVVGPAAAVGVLVPGLYMTGQGWGWAPWIVTSLGAYAALAAAGAAGGVRLLAVEPAGAEARSGQLSTGFLLSWGARVGIALGITFVMVVKPGWAGAVLAVLVASAAGAGAARLGTLRRPLAPEAR